ncbi:MAG: 4Fe-4S cluster-binding domain-containing protein [Deltaproteobacteria bacterium]|nr:4Fe-4S cluster-binding domain-containing protein [Deltaproteobacteria bacterium]
MNDNHLYGADPACISGATRYSPGCLACRNGSWLCIFLTYRCNAACVDCPAPTAIVSPHSTSGNTLEKILEGIETYQYKGISFSGGEALLEYETLLTWQKEIHAAYPDVYLWLYTNGIEATGARLLPLVDHGLNEIRFNLSATGYSDAGVLANMADACSIVPTVAVEVPATVEGETSLFNAVPLMVRAGVKYLNLHEFIPKHQSDEWESYYLDDQQVVSRISGIIKVQHSLAKKISSRFPSLVVNECTHEVKRHQMTMRRLLSARHQFSKDYEIVTPEGYIESILAENADGLVHWIHPADKDSIASSAKDCSLIRYLFRPSMTRHEKRKVISMEEMRKIEAT